MRKTVAFIANSLDSAYKFQSVLADIDVEVVAGSTDRLGKVLASDASLDLVIFEALASAHSYLDKLTSLVASRGCPLLLIVDEEGVADLPHLTGAPLDFVMHTASRVECAARVQRLLGGLAASAREEVIRIECMEINLATYQVTVNDRPVDFTYLEYALLLYLVQHPNHTFSRDVLLQNVWGFDYCGGSRTVDVHVRRIRSKLGPRLAEHLATVRGVGYFWQ